MKILEVVGARPQFVKLAPVDRALRAVAETVIIHTGQHYDIEMSAVFFDRLSLPAPNHNLNIGSGSHGAQTGEMLRGLEALILSERPDLVVVFGDTNSTLAGALAAVKLHVPVAHVEAGLRSMNRSMPEEINRIVTDHVSNLLFAPTGNAVECLKREGIVDDVHLVGDVMLDAILVHEDVVNESEVLNHLGIDQAPYALTTIHRAGNTDDPSRFSSLLLALNRLPMTVVFPVHPRTRHRIDASEFTLAPHVRLIDPVDYFSMLALQKSAAVVLTDSGGVQKEAYLLGTPCVTLREETEWTETVDAGWNVLVGCDPDAIIAAAMSFRPTGDRPAVFGDGTASKKIANAVVDFLESECRLRAT